MLNGYSSSHLIEVSIGDQRIVRLERLEQLERLPASTLLQCHQTWLDRSQLGSSPVTPALKIRSFGLQGDSIIYVIIAFPNPYRFQRSMTFHVSSTYQRVAPYNLLKAPATMVSHVLCSCWVQTNLISEHVPIAIKKKHLI